MAKPDNPSQLTFAVFCPAVISANGDGYTIKPGRPLLKLTAAQLGAQFGVDRETIYRWRQEGIIPDDLVERAGKRRFLFSAAAVDHLKTYFKALHE
ncbi:MAG: helix-turn-helix domain-containing protein [Patescibacteria group bacterium]|nr:helix-turn-helix domain-containing protein [Patescibacteria group bacterium]